MKTRDGFIQGFNAPAAVDATAQVILAARLSNQASDCPHLVGLVEQIASNLAAVPEQVSADAGDCSQDNPVALESRKIDAHIATGRHKHGATAPQARKPARSRRTAGRRRWRQNSARPVARVPLGCASRSSSRCSGRSNRRSARRQFLRRGLVAVHREWSLIGTVHNLLKLAAARRLPQPEMTASASNTANAANLPVLVRQPTWAPRRAGGLAKTRSNPSPPPTILNALLAITRTGF